MEAASPSNSVSSSASLVSVIELVLHVSSFKNIDLYRQGLYYLKTQFYVNAQSLTPSSVQTVLPVASPSGNAAVQAAPVAATARITAMPYYILTATNNHPSTLISPRESTATSLSPSVYPSAIDDDGHFFHTRTVRIQYCEQVCQLNDACLFRLELNARERPHIMLDVSLMFTEFTAQDMARGKVMPPPSAFERISKKTYELHGAYTGGIHTFLPILFDDQHYCMTESMVHSMMMEYRFRMPHVNSPQHANNNAQAKSPLNTSPAATPIPPPPPNQPVMAVASPASASVPSLTLPPAVPKALQSAAPPSTNTPAPAAIPPAPTTTSTAATTSTSNNSVPELTIDSPTNSDDAAISLASPSSSSIYYPPFAQIMFPRLLQQSTSSSPSPSPYTYEEMCSLADRYHFFFITNLIRAYNELAITFQVYFMHIRHELSQNGIDTRSSSFSSHLTSPSSTSSSSSDTQKQKRRERSVPSLHDAIHMKIKTLSLPDEMLWGILTDTTAQQQTTKTSEEKESNKDDQSVDQTTSSSLSESVSGDSNNVDESSIVSAEKAKKLRPPSITVLSRSITAALAEPDRPASPSLLPPLSPLASPLQTVTSPASPLSPSKQSRSILRAASPPPPSTSTAPPAPSAIDLDALTQRYHRRRRYSAIRLTGDDLRLQRSFNEERFRIKQLFTAPRLERLSVRLGSNMSFTTIAKTILSDMQLISQQSFQLWNILIQILPLLTLSLFTHARMNYDDLCHSYWSSFVFRESMDLAHRDRTNNEEMAELHEKVASVVRRRGAIEWERDRLQVRQVDRDNIEDQSVIFEEAYRLEDDVLGADSGANSDDEAESQRVHEEESKVADSLSEESVTVHYDQQGNGDASTDDGELDGSVMSISLNGASLSTRRSRPPTVNGWMQQVNGSDKSGTRSAGHSPSSPQSPATRRDTTRSLSVATPTKRDGQSSPAPTRSPPPILSSFSFPLSATLSSSASLLLLASATPPPPLFPPLPTFPPAIKQTNSTGAHVIILVHGYQGNSYDMRVWRNALRVICPDSILECSTANEGQTEGDIAQMGERLAAEVHSIVQTQCRGHLGRLTFVCHSLGGIIVRAALTAQMMQPYLPYLHTYVSLAAPHCGLIYGDSGLLGTGLWILKKWNKSICLSQLSLTDSNDITQCYLVKLAIINPLHYFDNILLLASTQDKYIPFSSARIEHGNNGNGGNNNNTLMNDTRSVAYSYIISALLSPLNRLRFKRFDINYVVKQKSIDSWIGRTAHIYFLDQIHTIQMFVTLYQHYFI